MRRRARRRTKIEDWTSGYVADIGYTYGYYAELNPLNTRLGLLYNAVQPPKISTACELGFGQGVSVNMHAAASAVKWWGTDFNPAHAAFAQELASASQAHADLSDDAFAEYCARDDIPPLDYIGLHGIWSWISDENRSVIVDFIRRKLKVGGVLYVSYNTQPGWAGMIPMRDLFVQHAELMGAEGQGRVARIDSALAFTEKLLSLNPAFSRVNPGIADRVKKLTGQNRNYLAHEYFNRDWEPMSFARMANWLSAGKVSYAGSAGFIESVDSMNLTQEQLNMLNEITDAGFRQTVRDFCTNQGFRKDYWVRGAQRLTPAEQMEQLRQLAFVMVQSREDVTFKVTGAQAEMSLNEDIYVPMLEVFSDHKPHTIGEVEKAVAGKRITIAQLIQGVVVLCGKGALLAAEDPAAAASAKASTDRLNARLAKAAAYAREVNYMASPVTGGGVGVPRFHQLFLASVAAGKKKPAEWAADVGAVLIAQSQQIVKDGKPLATPEENLAELQTQATDFGNKRLPIYRALGLI